MAKDDYHVIAYRILAYLYACLKTGEKPSLGYLRYGTEDFPIGKDYWNYILRHLYEDGFVEGVVVMPVVGSRSKAVKITEDIMVTPEGIAYLDENSAMQRAKKFLKELKETIPGL